MAKVYAFPTKRKLPGGIAKHYVETLYATVVLFDLESDKPSYEEVMELVAEAFAEGIVEAIDELDESE